MFQLRGVNLTRQPRIEPRMVSTIIFERIIHSHRNTYVSGTTFLTYTPCHIPHLKWRCAKFRKSRRSTIPTMSKLTTGEQTWPDWRCQRGEESLNPSRRHSKTLILLLGFWPPQARFETRGEAAEEVGAGNAERLLMRRRGELIRKLIRINSRGDPPLLRARSLGWDPNPNFS